MCDNKDESRLSNAPLLDEDAVKSIVGSDESINPYDDELLNKSLILPKESSTLEAHTGIREKYLAHDNSDNVYPDAEECSLMSIEDTMSMHLNSFENDREFSTYTQLPELGLFPINNDHPFFNDSKSDAIRVNEAELSANARNSENNRLKKAKKPIMPLTPEEKKSLCSYRRKKKFERANNKTKGNNVVSLAKDDDDYVLIISVSEFDEFRPTIEELNAKSKSSRNNGFKRRGKPQEQIPLTDNEKQSLTIYGEKVKNLSKKFPEAKIPIIERFRADRKRESDNKYPIDFDLSELAEPQIKKQKSPISKPKTKSPCKKRKRTPMQP